MRVIKARKGDSYEQIEMDIRAVMNGKRFLDNDNCFKKDTEVHFIEKRKKEKE